LGYFVVLGLFWATVATLHWLSWATGPGLPEYLYWVSHQHCPSTYTGFNHCYLLRYRSWRTAPRLLRSNIPRSALCATLDTYNLTFKFFVLGICFHVFITTNKQDWQEYKRNINTKYYHDNFAQIVEERRNINETNITSTVNDHSKCEFFSCG
jgi:hypothetical protein